MSALQDPLKFDVTKTSFVPILPYVATEMDTIFTSMINFQDVLKQNKSLSWVLWSDEGVYSIAKEIQLFKPGHFGKIFFGMGPFHMEKIVIACLGKFKADQDSTSCELDQQIDTTKAKLQQTLDVDRTVFKAIWEECKILLADVKKSFTKWKETACTENMRYWSLFLDMLYPILGYLTHSMIGIISFQLCGGACLCSSGVAGQTIADGVRCYFKIAWTYKGSSRVSTYG